MTFDAQRELRRFEAALEAFTVRLQGDRSILAAVLVGSLSEELMWRKDALSLWLIEVDGATKRQKSDGEEERIYRVLVENDINLWCELIPRSRFQRMLEGSSRTAFSCNLFTRRRLLFSREATVQAWFEEANRLATRDRERELLTVTTWLLYSHRRARQLAERLGDRRLAAQALLEAAHAVAAAEIVEAGEIYEQECIHRALELRPALFKTVYLDVLARPEDPEILAAALETLETYLEERAEANLKPLWQALRKSGEVVALTELANHFAASQIYPWHLETACEWLVRKGRLEKVSAPYKLTRKSRVELEEPAYWPIAP